MIPSNQNLKPLTEPLQLHHLVAVVGDSSGWQSRSSVASHCFSLAAYGGQGGALEIPHSPMLPANRSVRYKTRPSNCSPFWLKPLVLSPSPGCTSLRRRPPRVCLLTRTHLCIPPSPRSFLVFCTSRALLAGKAAFHSCRIQFVCKQTPNRLTYIHLLCRLSRLQQHRRNFAGEGDLCHRQARSSSLSSTKRRNYLASAYLAASVGHHNTTTPARASTTTIIMGCCGNRKKQTRQFADQKWDYINLQDFKATGCGTPFAYGYLWFSLILSIAVYSVDSFTAVQLIAFNRWSSTIKPAISFDVSKWIFSICIILSFINLGYEAIRATRVIKRNNIAECYMDPLAVRWESARVGKGQGFRRFLVFAALTKSKKGSDYIALFTYFSFKGKLPSSRSSFSSAKYFLSLDPNPDLLWSSSGHKRLYS